MIIFGMPRNLKILAMSIALWVSRIRFLHWITKTSHKKLTKRIFNGLIKISFDGFRKNFFDNLRKSSFDSPRTISFSGLKKSSFGALRKILFNILMKTSFSTNLTIFIRKNEFNLEFIYHIHGESEVSISNSKLIWAINGFI